MKPEAFNSLSPQEQIFAHLLMDILAALDRLNRAIDVEMHTEGPRQ